MKSELGNSKTILTQSCINMRRLWLKQKKWLKLKQLMRFFQPYLHVKEFPLSSRVTEHTRTQFQTYIYTNVHMNLWLFMALMIFWEKADGPNLSSLYWRCPCKDTVAREPVYPSSLAPSHTHAHLSLFEHKNAIVLKVFLHLPQLCSASSYS